MEYKRILGIIQNTVIVALMITMLYFAGKFMSIQTSTSDHALPSMPEAERNILEKNLNNNQSLTNKNIVVPSFVSICQNGQVYSSLYAGEMCETIWDYCKGLFKGIEELNLSKLSFNTAEDRNAYIDSILKSDVSLYLDFNNDIPSSVLFYLMSENGGFRGLTFMVNDMFIYPDQEGKLCFCTVDSDGNVYKSVSNKLPFNKEPILAYNYKAEFIKSKIINVRNNLTPLFEKSIKGKKVFVVNREDYFGLEPQTDITDNMLELFGLNPNNTRYFKSRENYTYVEDNAEVEVTPQGKIVVTSKDKGISLKNFLGYSPKGEDEAYSFFEKLTAVKNLINEFSIMFCSNDSLLLLNDVYYLNDGTVDFIFTCVMGGRAINDEQYTAKISIKENYLIYANLFCIECGFADDLTVQLPMYMAYELALGQNQDKLYDFDLVVEFENEENGISYYSDSFVSQILDEASEEVTLS